MLLVVGVGSVLLGGVLGIFFRVLILVPVIVFALVGIAVGGNLMAVLVAWVGLPAGYLVGAAARGLIGRRRGRP